MPTDAAPEPPLLLDRGAAVELSLAGRSRRFHAVWLRDNAQDPATRSPANGQRLISLLDLPTDLRVVAADWAGASLRVCFSPTGEAIDYPADWLAAHAYDGPAAPPPGWTAPDIVRWNAAEAAARPVERHDAVLHDPATRRRWLAQVRRYGFARLTGAPAAEGVAVDLAESFGHVRETNYGRAFDVRAEARPENLAYTSLGLQAHTDNPYRDPPPGLQLLACVRNAVEGGASRLVDAFKVAERLQAESPDGFNLLARHPARFAYAGAPGVRLSAKRPMIELGPDGELLTIRFNNRSAAPFTDIPYDAMAGYYAAYRRMTELVEDPDLGFRFRLEPGDVFIVDNMRVLHARDAFESSGERWLQGCYADRDGLLSTLAALEEMA